MPYAPNRHKRLFGSESRYFIGEDDQHCEIPDFLNDNDDDDVLPHGIREVEGWAHTMKSAMSAMPLLISWAGPSMPAPHALMQGQSIAYESLEEKFDALVKAWERHNAGRATLDFNHPMHLQIIGMGPDAVPLLLRQLQSRGGTWIFALKCITGIEAESKDMHGDSERVVKAWIDWGARHGFI